MKITEQELAKVSAGLANHFKKAADHHLAMAKCHTEMASYAKSKHDAMDDGDANKAMTNKTVEHHEKMAECHKAMSESCTAASEKPAAKAAGAAASEPVVTEVPAVTTTTTTEATGVDGMLEKTTSKLVERAITSLEEDPKVAERIQNFLLEKVSEALGNKLVPTDVKGALPNAQLVPRAGQPTPANKVEDLPPDFAFMAEE